MEVLTSELAAGPEPSIEVRSRKHPVLALASRRVMQGLVTVFLVSVVVFLATEVLPGNAAYSILGRSATPESIHKLELQLHLDQGIVAQYWYWFSGILRGDLGTSMSNGQSVTALVSARFLNSAVLVLLAGFFGTLVGVLAGAIAALRRDRPFDHALSISSLALTALPEFVIAIGLVLLFATNVFHWLPAISLLPPGTTPLSRPHVLVLPVATLVLVIFPYIARMMRAAMIEALESDYVEMARLQGISAKRILFFQALPNSIAPTIQVIGLNFLYLAGGIVVVEYIFDYPGIGQALVSAVNNRDIPVIQFIVVVLAAVYVVVNIVTDVVALIGSPRRRYAQ